MNKLKIAAVMSVMMFIDTSQSLEDSVVVIVNDRVILQSELNEKMREIKADNLSRIQLAKLKNDVLDQLIEESLLDQASSRMGIRVSDIDLQNQLKAIASSQGLTVLQLKDVVENQNLSYTKYLDKLRRNIKRQEVFRTQFTNRAYVSEEEIISFLKNSQIPEVDGRMKIKEHIILNKSDKLNLSQAKIILEGLKVSDIEEQKKKYPAYEIQTTLLEDAQIYKLPDIYQNNLQMLDESRFSSVFKTGKGYTMLEVIDSNILVDEYKVSHILLTTNPMEGSEQIKEKLFQVKKNVMSGEDFSKYAGELSQDKASALKGGSLGWIRKELVVDNFRKVMLNTPVKGVSEPFKTRFGWHILYLENKRTKNVIDTIKRNQAIAILKDRKVAVAKKEWLAKLKEQAYIEYVR
tara:strand:- start:1118 stop:2335 length:1218 start_codon:yes stop_codon:yes gene_type:complete